jgi:predicted transglutaminase-like cysteine proteinase
VQFKQSNLLKVSPNATTNLTSNDVNKLNRINAIVNPPVQQPIVEDALQHIVSERVEKPIAR